MLGMPGRGQQDPTAALPARLLPATGRLQASLCKAAMAGNSKALLAEQEEHDRHHMDPKGDKESPELQ